MSKQNRARTRAVRAEMAKTGANYTRAAARVGRATGGQDGSSTNAVREHVRRCLRAHRMEEEARLRRAEDLERAGHRIVDGGQEGPDTWVVYDWRTGQLLARGDDGLEGFDAAAEKLDPDETWFHCDHLDEDVDHPTIATQGVPTTFGQAIEDWLGQRGTPDEEIAEFIGWSTEEVQAHRD